MTKPLAIDLFCGLGGWTEGLLAEDYDVVGFDIERHEYGDYRYPGQLVIQDVCTLHGSQFKGAALIVASPPCQEYSYMAMPWKRAKAKAAAIRADTTGAELKRLNCLFNACLRIQFEASLAAGRRIPLIVENVKGAQPWVGRARWNFGSFYLWGDVPALMPITLRAQKFNPHAPDRPAGSWFAVADSQNRGIKTPGLNWSGSDKPGYVARGFNTTADQNAREAAGIKVGDAGWRERGPGRQYQDRAIKNNGGSWFNVAHNTTSGKGQNPDGRKFTIRQPGDTTTPRDPVASAHGANRKFASAMIAKIPFPLSRHIAATFRC